MAKRSDETRLDTEPANEKPAPGPRHTPDEWRLLLGKRASHHAAASVLHGWPEHAHHEGAPMRLTEAAYLEAVSEALKMPPTPSPNAVSPHRGRGK